MARVPFVKKEDCISCGMCVENRPAVFRFDADNKAEAYDPNGADEVSIQSIIDSCPVSCIYWEEKG